MTLVSGAPSGALTPLTTEEAIESLINADHRIRFRTGWSLDDKVGQVGVGEMALMWARSGSGKSTWTLNVIANTPEVPTLVVNMEMTARRQVEWLAAMSFPLPVAGRDVEDLLAWGEDDPRYEKLVDHLANVPNRYPDLHFAQPTRPSVPDLELMLDEIEDGTGTRPQRVFIDHLGLMVTNDDYSSYVRTAGDLHAFAMNHNVALYVIQQTGRSGGDQRNHGHIPVTLTSGVYAGEQDADWVFGMYRPDRNPKFSRHRDSMNPEEWWRLQDELEAVKGLTYIQVIKNRPFGDLIEEGIPLVYNPYTRRYAEQGA